MQLLCDRRWLEAERRYCSGKSPFPREYSMLGCAQVQVCRDSVDHCIRYARSHGHSTCTLKLRRLCELWQSRDVVSNYEFASGLASETVGLTDSALFDRGNEQVPKKDWRLRGLCRGRACLELGRKSCCFKREGTEMTNPSRLQCRNIAETNSA